MKSEKMYVGCTKEEIVAAAAAIAANKKHADHMEVVRALRFAMLSQKNEVPKEKGTGCYRAITAAKIGAFLGGDKEEHAALIAAALKGGAIAGAAVFGYMQGYTLPGIEAPPPVKKASEELAELRKQYGDI